MNEKKLSYLKSLLAWGKDIEEKAQKTEVNSQEMDHWKKQLVNWKVMLQELLESDEEPSEEQIAMVQEKSVKLLDLLQLMIEKPRNSMRVIPAGKHRLPELPYSYDALEPYISRQIMRLHHDQHHKSYVEGLNRAELQLYKNQADEKMIKHWLREQAFHGSGHFLHTLFWENMSPEGGGRPSGELLRQIEADFGSFANFKTLFTKAAESVEGVGWAILNWENRSGRLAIQTAEKHQMFSLWDVTPLLVLDVWEHAYYLQYKNNRSDYIKNWWNIVNWPSVSNRLEEAKKMKYSLT
ncbi:superoxide dismutase [Sediminibacillus albus]|uniref:superoxide dismutase n=1 Tax=Sediminibacillus albus TaxID=407036 RepID=A0A1G8VKA2_9BACI|nr:superoxide dismutase [Sediminibacillus albus]SDJ66546.1 superoxide dismutase, Fe-Mn family [Sediminibacillus albus]